MIVIGYPISAEAGIPASPAKKRRSGTVGVYLPPARRGFIDWLLDLLGIGRR